MIYELNDPPSYTRSDRIDKNDTYKAEFKKTSNTHFDSFQHKTYKTQHTYWKQVLVPKQWDETKQHWPAPGITFWSYFNFSCN